MDEEFRVMPAVSFQRSFARELISKVGVSLNVINEPKRQPIDRLVGGQGSEAIRSQEFLASRAALLGKALHKIAVPGLEAGRHHPQNMRKIQQRGLQPCLVPHMDVRVIEPVCVLDYRAHGEFPAAVLMGGCGGARSAKGARG